MFFISFVLVTPSIFLLRRLAQSTNSMRSWILQKLHISTGDKRRKPRTVWSNPIAWREAKTKASAARASILRYAFIAAGLGGAVVLVVMYATTIEPPEYVLLPDSYDAANRTLTLFGKSDPPQRMESEMIDFREGKTASTTVQKSIALLPRGQYKLVNSPTYVPGPTGKANVISTLTLAPVDRRVDIDTARKFLLGMIAIEFAVILLIVTNAAASTVTREKEDGSLDLLLATPITGGRPGRQHRAIRHIRPVPHRQRAGV
jgi:hypothetical protein